MIEQGFSVCGRVEKSDAAALIVGIRAARCLYEGRRSCRVSGRYETEHFPVLPVMAR